MLICFSDSLEKVGTESNHYKNFLKEGKVI